jgi:hypothetical protein
LERRPRSHSQPAVPADGSDLAKSTFDVLVNWLTAKESQPTVILLGMAGIATTGVVTYLTSGSICMAAADIAKAVSANGSEAVVGVAQAAAPAVATIYLGTQVIWEASDTIRGYFWGLSTSASSSAGRSGRVLGEVEDPPLPVRGLPSPSRRVSRSQPSRLSTSQRCIRN